MNNTVQSIEQGNERMEREEFEMAMLDVTIAIRQFGIGPILDELWIREPELRQELEELVSDA